MSRRKKVSIACVSILVVLMILSAIVSIDKFSTANPFAAISGLLQITFTEKEYVELKKSPKVIIAKSDGTSFNKLVKYMDNQGYTHSEDEQEGSMHTFSNKETDDIEYIIFSSNKYYSIWEWRD